MDTPLTGPVHQCATNTASTQNTIATGRQRLRHHTELCGRHTHQAISTGWNKTLYDKRITLTGQKTIKRDQSLTCKKTGKESPQVKKGGKRRQSARAPVSDTAYTSSLTTICHVRSIKARLSSVSTTTNNNAAV